MKKKILIVDDEEDWLQVLTMRLEHEGYQTKAALDAVQAVMHILKFLPDLILLDIMMPAGGGLTVLKNIKVNVKTFSIPIIVITGIGDDKQTKEAIEKLGVFGYFTKPVDMDELLEKIKKILIK